MLPVPTDPLRLNLNFIIGSVTTNLSALFVGSLLDHYGPKLCGLISCVILFLGSLSMALESSLPIDGYALGFLLLALGGTFSFVPSFHLSNAFPQFQGLILALITGAFDASAAVFLVFRLLYQSGRVSIRQFFIIYLLIPIFILLANLFLLPSQSFETRSEVQTYRKELEDDLADLHDSDDDLPTTDMFRVRSSRAAKRKESVTQIDDLIGSPKAQVEHDVKEDDKKIASGVWGILHGIPARKQMVSPWFILIALFTVLQMTRFNFFIATIWSQYEYMLESRERATEVTEFFDLALPIGGVATVPFIGLLLDHTSTVTVLSLLVLMSTVIGALGAIPNATAAYTNVCLFVIFRPLYYSAMSDYATKVFGFATFGTVYGTIVCLSGLSLFSQPVLQALVHVLFYEDPGPANLGLAGAGLLIGTALVMYVDTQARNVRKVQLQVLNGDVDPNDLDDDRRSLLSVSLGGGAVNGPGNVGTGVYGGPGLASFGHGTGRMRSPSPRLRPADANQSTHFNPGLYANYGSFAFSGGGLSAAQGLAGSDDRLGEDGTTLSPQGTYRIRHKSSKQGVSGLGQQLSSVHEGIEPGEEEQERNSQSEDASYGSPEVNISGVPESGVEDGKDDQNDHDGRDDDGSDSMNGDGRDI